MKPRSSHSHTATSDAWPALESCRRVNASTGSTDTGTDASDVAA